MSHLNQYFQPSSLIIFSFPLYEKHYLAKWFFLWQMEHALPWAAYHCLVMCFKPQHMWSNILFSDCGCMCFPLWLETAHSSTATDCISMQLTCCCDNSHAWQIFIAPYSVSSASLWSGRVLFTETRVFRLLLVIFYWKHNVSLHMHTYKPNSVCVCVCLLLVRIAEECWHWMWNQDELASNPICVW